MKSQNLAFNGDASRRTAYIVVSLVLLAATMDWPAIAFGGATVRLAWIILPFLFIIVSRELRFHKAVLLFCLTFLVASIPSIYISLTPQKSTFYILWLLLNYFVFFSIFYTATKQLGGNILIPIVWVSRFHIAFGLLLFVAGIQERPASFFYETSYLSIALIPYAVAIVYKMKCARWFDYVLLLCFALTSRSAALLVIFGALGLVLSARYLLRSGHSIRNLLKVGAWLSILITFGLVYIYTISDINTRVLRAVIENLSPESMHMLLMRGGNRYPRIVAAYNVISENWIAGVGLGSYETYSLSNEINDPGFSDWYLSATGMPAVNVWLEVFATVGIAGFMCFSIATMYLAKKALTSDSQFRWLIISIVFSIFIVMNFESNYMRAYLWCYLGMVLGLAKISSNEVHLSSISESLRQKPG